MNGIEVEVLKFVGPPAGAVLVVVFLYSKSLRGMMREQQASQERLTESWQKFLSNHMKPATEAQRETAQALLRVAERLGGLEARVSDCPVRGDGDGGEEIK